MATITVNIEESKLLTLKEKAESYGLRLEQFIAASVEDLVSQPEPEFDQAVEKILAKNKELYKRLS